MLHFQTFTVNQIFEHPYLVWDDTLETVIIDPGFGSVRATEQLAAFVEKKGLRPGLTFLDLPEVFLSKNEKNI